MRWILHIGTQKTGSKAIQSFFATDSKRINGCRFCFPKAGRTGHWHQPLHDELSAGGRDFLRAAIDEAREMDADLAMISYEALYLLQRSRIEVLHELVGPAQVILFIRRQDQLANSRCNQLIKAHRVDYQQILDFESSILEFNPDYDHMRTIQKWGSVFGIENTLPIIYEKRINSTKELLGRIGVSANFEGYEYRNHSRALDARSLSTFRAIKQRCTDSKDLPNLIRAAHLLLGRNFVDTYSKGDQYLLSMAQRETIYSHYAESNDQLRRMFFPERTSLFADLEESAGIRTDMPVDESTVREVFEKAGLPAPSPEP